MPPESDLLPTDDLFSSAFTDAPDGSSEAPPAPSAAAPPREGAAAGQEPEEATGTTAPPAEPDDVPKYTEREFQKRRAEQNSRADKATARAQQLESQIAAFQQQLADIDAERQAYALALQQIEQRAGTDGVTPFDVVQTTRNTQQQIQTDRQRQQAEAAQRAQYEAAQRAQQELVGSSQQQAQQAYFERKVLGLERAALSEGLPTLDAETMLRDEIMSETMQLRVEANNLIPDPAKRAKANDLLYQDAITGVMNKIRATGTAKAATESKKAATPAAPQVANMTPEQVNALSVDDLFANARW